MLRLDITSEPHAQGFVLKNLQIEGAEYSTEEQQVRLSSTLLAKLPNVRIMWANKKDVATDQQEVLIPVYLNQTRANLLFSVHLPTRNEAEYVWYQRGVALVAWGSE